MVTKLKSSIQYEIFLISIWIVWSLLLTITTNFFAGMEILAGKMLLYVRACVIGGAIGVLILGGVLLWSTVWYLMSIWGRRDEPPARTILDRIPCEFLVLAVSILGSIWWYDEMFYESSYYWFNYEEIGRLYYLVEGFIGCLGKQIVTLALFWLTLWTLTRQICYRWAIEQSLCMKVYRKHCSRRAAISQLGQKIAGRQWLLRGLLLGSVISVGLGFLYAWDGDTDISLLFVLLYIACQFSVIIYLRISGVSAPDIVSLVEQIRAVSQAETIGEEFEISRKSLFYEPFHQLEELDEAVKRSAQKQLEAERLKVDLITNVSHDLKTPLTSMVGYTDLLKQEELSPEARDYVDIIAVKQEQLKEMIQQLFELSKATSGVEQLKLETLDMRKLMEQILGDMEDRIQSSGQTIRTDFDEPPLLFVGDNEKMYRVVQNLLENALKYSLEHTRIYIEVKREEKRLILRMKNIASYEMCFSPGEITERFVRGDQSRTTEGHGLGLAIASSFTQNMGGLLTVDVDGDLFKVTVDFPACE